MDKPQIYVVSGGSGASGDQLVQTALAQFPDDHLHVRIFSNIREKSQVDQMLQLASEQNTVIVHTMVDEEIFSYLKEKADKLGIDHLDVMQILLRRLSSLLDNEPVGHPGLYRTLHKDYFDRVAAIEYTIAHDDGRGVDGWAEAEIVITGVSRVGKTPLSMYLSVLGWKVANVPLIFGIEPHPSLFTLEKRRLVGLTMHPGQLMTHRQHRQKRLGAIVGDYASPQKVFEEIEYFDSLLRSKNIHLLDVTDKPIETSADEVLRYIQRR